MDTILSIAGLSKSFGGLAAVRNVALELRQGEILSLIGPNGAGKTTTFNLITGFVRPSTGTVTMGGREITGWTPHRIAAAGMVRTFQKTHVFPQLSVLDNVVTGHYLTARVSLWRTLARGPRVAALERSVRDSAEEILSFLRLSHRSATEARNLAYGELRLLEIAIALGAKPKVLLLDEPAAGLNIEEAAKLVGLMRRLNEERRISIVLVEHNMGVVMDVSDRVAVMNFGEKIADDVPIQVRSNPAVIEAYLGKPH